MMVYDYYIGKKFGENIHEGSGLIAEDHEHAMKLLEEEFGLQGQLQKGPVRCNQKKDMYRCSLYAKERVEDYIARQCEKVQCLECKRTFRRMTRTGFVEIYDHCGDDNKLYCSTYCYDAARTDREVDSASLYYADGFGVIYKITKKSTGECYVGQTVRSWTLRWWEHFTQGTAEKFQKAISSTPLEDWTFEILEKIHLSTLKGNPKILTYLEGKYIEQFDSVANGFNTRKESTEQVTSYPLPTP